MVKALKIIAFVLCSILLVVLVFAGINKICEWRLNAYIDTFMKVEYENQLAPKEDGGITTFVTDDSFKLVQITDVHLGGGFLSVSEDSQCQPKLNPF